MKRRKRMLSVCLAVALLFTAALPAGAVTQSDIQAIKNQLGSVTARKEEAEAQLAAIRGDLSRAQEQVELVQEQVLLTEQQVSAGRELLAQYDRQIGDNQQEIAELEAKEARQLEQFYQQVRWMEETGGTSYLSVLFDARSFSRASWRRTWRSWRTSGPRPGPCWRRSPILRASMRKRPPSWPPRRRRWSVP